MSNIVRVTEYLRGVLAEAGEDSENRVLTCIPTVTGEFMFRDNQNRYWRTYRYIHDAVAYDRVEKPEHNLIRAHAQMKLLERIEGKYDQICAITEEIIRNR